MPANLQTTKISKPMMLVFLAVFALAGLLVWKIFAASNTIVVQAEKLKLASDVKVYGDKSAKGGKAIVLHHTSKTPLTTTVTTNESIGSVSVLAKATACGKKYPLLQISISNGSKTKRAFNAKINSKDWETYTGNNVNLPKGDGSYAVSVSYQTSETCTDSLNLDQITFNLGSSSKGGGGKKHGGGGGGGSQDPTNCVKGSNCNGDPCAYPQQFKKNKCVDPDQPVTVTSQKEATACVLNGTILNFGSCDTESTREGATTKTYCTTYYSDGSSKQKEGSCN